MIFTTLPQALPPGIPHIVSSAAPDSFQIKANSSLSATLLPCVFFCFTASQRKMVKSLGWQDNI